MIREALLPVLTIGGSPNHRVFKGHRTISLAEIHKAFQLMIDGSLTGKLVLHPDAQH